MTAPDLTLLQVPWGLIGSSKTRIDIASSNVRPDTESSVAPLLLSRNHKPVLLNGDERLPELFVELRPRGGDIRRVWDLPVPLHAAELQTLKFHGWDRPTTLLWQHGVDRPTLSEKDEIDSTGEEPGAPIYRFLRTIRARIQDFETIISAGLDPWDHVPDLWLDPQAPRDPTMDILVRHARTHRANWSDVAEHPRRLLNRRRELVSLSRVQELDVQCMQWLSRQPGETLAERAGGRQRIMALARYENRNILENRVFMDLMVRSVAAARDYLAMNKGRTGRIRRPLRTTRLQLIETYKRECRHIQAELAMQGVSRETDSVHPNYVLLYDQRYRHVWTARQEIIRRERVMDELWRWQRRSWAEFCQVAVSASLIWIEGAQCAFASPVLVRAEHNRGHWLAHDDPTIVVAQLQKGWVVEVLSGSSEEVPESARELCASFWLRFTDLKGSGYRYLAVWAVHCVGQATTLRGLVESASEGMHLLRDRGQLIGGLVLSSLIDPTNPTHMEHTEFVSGCAFGPHDTQLPTALELLGENIHSRVRDSLWGR